MREPRNEKSVNQYNQIFKNSNINKFISDIRLNSEKSWNSGIITNRKFSKVECNLASSLSIFLFSTGSLC